MTYREKKSIYKTTMIFSCLGYWLSFGAGCSTQAPQQAGALNFRLLILNHQAVQDLSLGPYQNPDPWVDFFAAVPDDVGSLVLKLSDASGTTINDTQGSPIDRSFPTDIDYLLIKDIPEAKDLSLTINALGTLGSSVLYQAMISPIEITSGQTTVLGALKLESYSPSAATQPSSGSSTTTSASAVVIAGSGSVSSPFLVDSAAKLKLLNETLCTTSAAGCSSAAKLTSDIDLKNEILLPIGSTANPFNGVFDGGGFTIKNFVIASASSDGIGFVGTLGPLGVIQSVNFEGANIIGQNQVGIVVGINEGAVSQVQVNGQVAGKNAVGGLVGFGKPGSSIKSSISSATVVASADAAGGVMGQGAGVTLTSVSASGKVTSSLGKAGGAVGYLTSDTAITLSRISASGNVLGVTQTGGLIGEVSGSVTLSICQASGAVEPTKTTGSMTGGGLIGLFAGTAIERCSAKGSVTPTALSLTVSESGFGGLVGRLDSGQISNSFASGTVKGVSSGGPAGALVGLFNDGLVTKSLSAGAVSVGSNKGGVVGRYVGGSFSESYWDRDTTGMANTYQGSGGDAAGTSGKSTAESFTQATYTGWDFSSIWQINEGLGYPTLRDQP